MSGYTAQVMRHLVDPVGAGPLDAADAVGESGAVACGDQVRIQLSIRGRRVTAARFLAFGCPAATAAASLACERLSGATLDEGLSLSATDLDRGLGGLGAARRHGADLVADAVARAFEGWFSARLGDAGIPLRRDRIAVAMSGGVDSAVAALLLRDAGWDVVGVTMRLWHDPAAAAAERSCCSPETMRMARETSHALGIPHVAIDAADAFRQGVVDGFIEGYAKGLTPNPCVVCNGSVRFRLLAQAAALVGARGLATGHYARVVRTGGTATIAAARDAAKDQSYMLAMLPPAVVARLQFPLGDLTKTEVRERARCASLVAAEAVESQEVCFVGQGGYVPFLERNAGLADRPGDIVDADGVPVGRHHGYWRFTVGQRKGIGVAGPEPLYVLGTDAAANRVTVGPRTALASRRVELVDVVCHAPLDPGHAFELRVRYRGRPLAGRSLTPTDDASAVIELDDATDGVAPGQTAVVYQDGRVIAAGTIATSHSPHEVSCGLV